MKELWRCIMIYVYRFDAAAPATAVAVDDDDDDERKWVIQSIDKFEIAFLIF